MDSNNMYDCFIKVLVDFHIKICNHKCELSKNANDKEKMETNFEIFFQTFKKFENFMMVVRERNLKNLLYKYWQYQNPTHQENANCIDETYAVAEKEKDDDSDEDENAEIHVAEENMLIFCDDYIKNPPQKIQLFLDNNKNLVEAVKKEFENMNESDKKHFTHSIDYFLNGKEFVGYLEEDAEEDADD